MALMNCPDCARDVSDKAATCPHCGYPIGPPARASGSVQVIEKIGRRWKAVRVAGWVLIVAGVVVLRAGRATHGSGRAPLGWWLAGAGVGCLLTSRAGAWWYHG